MANSKQSNIASRREPLGGYFSVMGSAQILVGVIHVFYSVIGLYWFLDRGVLGDAGEGLGWGKLGALYLGLQVILGWLLGALTVWAGVETRMGRRRSFVRGVAIANLFFLPLGTLVGALVLAGLRRQDVRKVFIEEPLPTSKAKRRRARRVSF